jgi:2-aminomuconate deaminase
MKTNSAGDQPQTIHSERAAPPVGPYPHARRAGQLLFLSGVGPRRPGTTEIPGVTLSPDGSVESYDVKTQTHACFENIAAVLEAAGLNLSNVVDVQIFLTDIKRDFKEFNEVYGCYFSSETGPARTTIGVTGLPTPIHVELKAIALFPKP